MIKLIFPFLLLSGLDIPSFSQGTTYSVIDIKPTKGGINTAIARDSIGRTVSFKLIPVSKQITNKKKLQNSPGSVKKNSEMIVDLNSLTAALKNDSSLEFNLEAPSSSRAIGTVTSLSPYIVSLSSNGLAAYVKIKLNSGQTENINIFPFVPGEHDFWNKPVYENIYDRKKFATFLPSKPEEINKVLFSFELMEEDVSNPQDSAQSSQVSGEELQNLMNVRPWEISKDSSLKEPGGEITLELPRGISYSTHLLFYNTGDTKKALASWFGNNKSKLPAGFYDVRVDGKYTLYNVPVLDGKQTRLKMGFLSVGRYGPVTISNGSDQKFTYAAPFTILLPEGTYFLPGEKTRIIIKDAKQLKL